MLFGDPLPFVNSYIEILNRTIKEHKPDFGLSVIQRAWLAFCIMGIFVTNSECWAKFNRFSIGGYSSAALSWMFRKSKIFWDYLLHMSTEAILCRFKISQACMAVDDTHKKRSKKTAKIAWVHKLKDKASGGFIMGQSIIFLALITPRFNIPVGFDFYLPDPNLSAWYKRDAKLKEQGVSKRDRPPKPARNPNYPTKQDIALKKLTEFKCHHTEIEIQCILADALYGTGKFLDRASAIYDGAQVISQLRENQNLRFRKNKVSVKEYFAKHPGVPQTIKIRGDKPVKATIGSARLQVIRDLVNSDDPEEKLACLSETLKENILAPSKKHMSGRELGRLEATTSLKYRAATVMAYV